MAKKFFCVYRNYDKHSVKIERLSGAKGPKSRREVMVVLPSLVQGVASVIDLGGMDLDIDDIRISKIADFSTDGVAIGDDFRQIGADLRRAASFCWPSLKGSTK